MEIERKRPIKQFEVLQAHGPYRKGDLIQPTGMYRDVLLRRGLIREVKDAAPAEAPAGRALQAPENRMVSAASGVASFLSNRGGRGKRR